MSIYTYIFNRFIFKQSFCFFNNIKIEALNNYIFHIKYNVIYLKIDLKDKKLFLFK